MAKILVVAELNNENDLKTVTTEMVSQAKRISEDVAGVVIGQGTSEKAAELSNFGCDTQFVADDDRLKKISIVDAVALIAEAAEQFSADQIWFPTNELAKAVMPRLSLKLDTICVGNVFDIEISGNNTVVQRPAYSGKLTEKVKFLSSPAIFSVRAGAFEAEPLVEGTQNVVELSLEKADLRTKVQEILHEASGELDLSEADFIVSAGRGTKGPEGVEFVKAFADKIGAAFGASRAVVDSGWQPQNKQVGQTGIVVNPTLYVAVGISGAIQHLAGMSASKIIVAVNNDPEAPIFNVTDYGIVGDLFEVLPVLEEEILKRR